MKTTVLQPSKHTAKTYNHFTVLTKEVPVALRQTDEFFYLGSDKSKIDFLIRTFGTGYAPDNVAKAISLLQRLPSLQSKPAFIIVDALLGEHTLREIFSHLSLDKYYDRIPLILEASDIDESAISAFRNLGILDEIVFINSEEDATFTQKITFLRKIKQSATSRTFRKEIPARLRNKWVPRAITKRAFDLLFSAFAIIFLLPVFVLVAVLVKLESPGPVFYISKRAGRGYKIFNFFKFRTMILDADKNLEELWHLNKYKSGSEGKTIFFKGDNDPRVTRIGMFLRRTSLDELPQLFNVFAGNMSLVGNRPLPLTEAASLTTDEWAARFLAPAGMTGLWQIRRKFQHNMTVEQRINLDIAYAHKYNFLYDLWIMAKTPSAVIQRSNS